MHMNTGPVLNIELDRRQPLGLQIEQWLRGLVQSQTIVSGPMAGAMAS